MRRKGRLIEHIVDADNLRLAFWKASRGKRTKAEVIRFRANLDHELSLIREELLDASLPWGPYYKFEIQDPKPRTICAAPFRDRVAHHALMNVAEPVFEAYQIHDSYACRKGKGLDAAIYRSRRFSRQGTWYLKMDVRKYFDSVDHHILKVLLRHRFKDQILLRAFDAIIDSYATGAGHGIPIGNLTSQFFANHYLGLADHYIKEDLHCRRYVRYMDDFVIWHAERRHLRLIREKVVDFLEKQLKLRVNAPSINSSSRGLTFLGYRIFPGHVRLARRSRDRFRKKFAKYQQYYEDGLWDESTVARHVEPMLAFLKRGESFAYRERVLNESGLCPRARTA